MDMTGKSVVVTGATDGIGLVTARKLAEKGAKLGLVARNPDKAASVIEALKAETGNDQIEFFQADLSDLTEVRAVAKKIAAAFPTLDVLINNAGAMFNSRALSADGIEMTMALNHFSVFLLTNLLLDPLSRAEGARVVTVSSIAHRGADIDFENLKGTEGRHSGWRAYQRSKLANILFTRELARRVGDHGITANCLHPGFVASKFGENNNPLMTAVMKLGKLFAISPEKGAETSVYLACAAAIEGESGGYYAQKKKLPPSAQARNAETASRLWEESAKLVGLENA